MNGLMVSMIAFVAGVKDRLTSEKGATAVEYGIMVALIAVVIIVAVTTLGTNINSAFADHRRQDDSPALSPKPSPCRLFPASGQPAEALVGGQPPTA